MGYNETLNLGRCFARFREDYGLEICMVSTEKEAASFVRIDDSKNLECLRDALLERYPRRSERPAFEGRFHAICGKTYTETEIESALKHAEEASLLRLRAEEAERRTAGKEEIAKKALEVAEPQEDEAFPNEQRWAALTLCQKALRAIAGEEKGR